uniref:Uncharacterized protein n=1 Tax=Neobacillus citreus TaxID=2833578 RepID=A0A942SZE9_9BACI
MVRPTRRARGAHVGVRRAARPVGLSGGLAGMRPGWVGVETVGVRESDGFAAVHQMNSIRAH